MASRVTRIARLASSSAVAIALAAAAASSPVPSIQSPPPPALPIAKTRLPRPAFDSIPDMLSATIPAVCKVTGIDGRGQRLGGGSGFVVDDSGHVVTNAHVIVGLTSMGAHELIASFDDGRVLQLEALALDVEADIAVARLVTPDGTSTVPHLTFGSSSALRRGDPVAVLGAPLGGSIVPTLGVLSGCSHAADDDDMARNRGGGLRGDATGQGLDLRLVQVDAALSSGSSGGPIVNSDGQVVGVSVLVKSGMPFFQVGTLSFGIAGEQVGAIVNALIADGMVQRPVVGLAITLIDTLDAARELDATGVARLPPNHQTGGVLVSHVQQGAAASAGGLRAGDVMLSVDGKPLRRKGDFFSALGPVYAPDKELKIEVWRPLGPGLGGKLLQVTVKPTSRGLPVPVQRSERRHALW